MGIGSGAGSKAGRLNQPQPVTPLPQPVTPGDPSGGGKGGQPSQPGAYNRGLVGQIEDAYSQPLDFSTATPLATPDFSRLQGVSAGRAPLVRDRGLLADRTEGLYRTYEDRYGDIDSRYALASPDSYTADREALERASYDRAMHLLGPEFQRQEQAIQTDLTNRGLAPTSEAYRDMYGDFSDRRGRTLTDLSLASVMAGAQEHQRLADLTSRNRAQLFGEAGGMYGAGMGNIAGLEGLNQAGEAEHARMAQRQLALRAQQAGEAQAGADAANRNRQMEINEMLLQRQQPTRDLASLLAATGGLPQMPQFTQYNAPAGDLMGLAGSNYAAQQSRAGANKGGMLGALGSLGGAAISSGLFSDRRLKEDIERVGTLDNGLPVYVYRFKGDGRTFMGLMADEVEKVRPEAVETVVGTDLKTVDYRKAVA